ncbi:MAG TPA: hypothetical protein VFB23_12480 [Candidatus Acidoferrales bacterium]|jgi:hypothetical protein|nr:hypothetical protein [Candidatus Acidoferrales bacterium]
METKELWDLKARILAAPQDARVYWPANLRADYLDATKHGDAKRAAKAMAARLDHYVATGGRE